MAGFSNLILFVIIFLLITIIVFQFYYYKIKSKRERDIERVVKKERNLLQTLIDIIPDTIYYKDRKSRFLMINKAQASVLGLNSPKEAIGRDDFDFFAHAQQAFDEEQKMMQTGKPVINSIIEIKTVSGDRLDLMETKLPVYDEDGKCTGLVGISRNITELMDLQKELIKAKEKAEESDKLKSAFLANMSHEIRTPLNAIVGFSELLAEEDETIENKQEYLRIIRNNNELLLKLIEDILNLSRIESGALEINETVINIGHTFNDIAETHRLNLNKNIKITCSIPDNSLICQVDEGKLVQVLNNLIANALKFTSKGKIEIGYKNINGKIEAFVSDTGEGIPKENLENIFKSFVKSDEFKHGTGLGLAICKNLIKIMGGEIWVESELGKGSTFSFTFPYKKPVISQPNKGFKKLEPPIYRNKTNLKGIRILVAEDNHANYRLLESMINKMECIIERAINGIEAMDKFREFKPDIVFMDLKMPEMDGYEAARSIKEIQNDVPIIAVTANAFEKDKSKAFEAGCNDLIVKPISKKAVLEMVQKYALKK